MLRGGRERLLGLEAVAQHDRRGQGERQLPMREAPRVEQRRGDHRRLARLERDARQQRGDGVERARARAVGSLRGSGRARGEDHGAARLLRRVDLVVGAVDDQVLEQRVLGLAVALEPADEPLAPPAALGDELGELLVVDQRGGLLALHHVGDLRPGEARVQVQPVRPELGQRHAELDEVAVVAAQHADVVALVDAGVGQRVAEAVGALVDVLERQGPELVDDRRLVGVADRRGGVARGRGRAPAGEREAELEDPVRAVEGDDAGPEEDVRGPGLVDDVIHGRRAHGRDPITAGAGRAAPRRDRAARRRRRPAAG